MSEQACFHCGLPAEPQFAAKIDGETKDFCCIGCQMVAQAIADGGLSQFYQYRDSTNEKSEQSQTSYSAYDLPEVQEDFVVATASSVKSAHLTISNIACAACAWLIEHYLEGLHGVKSVRVNVSTHRCDVDFEPAQCALSDIFSALARIGYQAHPFTQASINALRKTEERGALLRLGVAGLGMMQVGMVAVALHAGAIQGMETHWLHYLRWVSLIFATPVILYSARPFFQSAFRALRLRSLNMDVPVSLALILAYTASLWATFSGRGEVYFDSVSMFTFFLLAGRFFEMRVRHSSAFATESLSQLLPRTADKMEQGQRVTTPLRAIAVADTLWVAAGEVFPCDGRVLEGTSSANEMLISGESLPQVKRVGDSVLAGSINSESALVIEVTHVGAETQLAQVEALVDKATHLKPHMVAVADKLSRYFVAAVIIIAVSVASIWAAIEPSKAFWVALSVLVVTCPCALSLATPTALTAGILRMRFLGVLVAQPQFIEKLAQTRRIVFDKTGTLTHGALRVERIQHLTDQFDDQQILQWISALEVASNHPIATAFHPIKTPYTARDISVHPAAGVSGEINDSVFRFGKREFAVDLATQGMVVDYPGDGLWQLLSRDGQPCAWVLLADQVRSEISGLLHQLHDLNIQVELLSGDRQQNVESFARCHGIANYYGGVSPEGKLQHIERLREGGETVLMVGDGINDVPVLRGADVSIAMGSASRLAQSHADAVMANENLLNLVNAIALAKRVSRTVRQNLLWALLYNAIALPAAAMGWIPPYLAAIGMSASSLVVVLNAWRLRFFRTPTVAGSHTSDTEAAQASR